jgi:hypothetical protein
MSKKMAAHNDAGENQLMWRKWREKAMKMQSKARRLERLTAVEIFVSVKCRGSLAVDSTISINDLSSPIY